MHTRTVLIFIIISLLVIFLQYDLLKPAFEIGLTPEDREFILRFKTLGPNPLTKIFEVWSQRGAYTTVPIYYVGVIESFTGFNYPLIQFMGTFFKTLATLSIFSLVLLVFKNKWLASLTSILFAISYTTAGALETGVEPSEYLGLLMMNFFLIAYYYLNTKYLLQLKWLILTALLLFIAVIASVMRVYPILVLIPLVEIFLWILDRKKYKLKYLVGKLFILYLPFLILNYFFPTSTGGHFSLPSILSGISQGNWHLVLTPLQGLGFMIPVSMYYDNLGILDLNNFNTYLEFLLGGPTVIFGAFALLLSWISMHRPVPLFLRIFTLNFSLELLSYFLVKHSRFIPAGFRLNYDLPRFFPVLFGLFILSVAVNYFVLWFSQGRKNNLFLALWLGPFIALFFITMTYFFASLELSFGGAQDHYLLIPTLGIGLLIAGILLLLHKKLSTLRFGSIISIFFIFSILFSLYILNRQLIYNYFNTANSNGRSAAGQLQIQTRIKQKLRNIDYSRPLLVYFDTSEITGNGPFYSESLLTPFPFFMHMQDEKVLDGCIGVIYEDNKMIKLRGLVKNINDQLIVTHQFVCVNGYRMTTQTIQIKLDELYAYKIKDKDFIDIKGQVLRELEL